MRMEDSHVMVTGAGSGLGAAVAEALAGLGARITVVDRNGDAAADTAARIDGQALALDVTDPEAGMAVDRAIAALGPLRGLVNCAGIGGAARIVGRDGRCRSTISSARSG